jgi:sulfonate transport system permease protein
MKHRGIVSLASAWIVPVVLVFSWEMIVRAQFVPPSQSAAPSTVIVRMTQLIASGVLIKHAGYSVARLLIGVILGTIIAVFSSISLASLPKADRVFSPTVQLFAGVPIVLWMPFCVMFFGTGEVFKVSLTAISAFFLVHTSVFQAIRTIENDYIELADVYEKSFAQKLRDVLLPFATPAIFTALRASFALGWIVLFFVEYASSKEGKGGLGWFIADSRAVGRIEEEFAGLILLAFLAFIVDKVLGGIRLRFLEWSDSLESTISMGDL